MLRDGANCWLWLLLKSVSVRYENSAFLLILVSSHNTRTKISVSSHRNLLIKPTVKVVLHIFLLTFLFRVECLQCSIMMVLLLAFAFRVCSFFAFSCALFALLLFPGLVLEAINLILLIYLSTSSFISFCSSSSSGSNRQCTSQGFEGSLLQTHIIISYHHGKYGIPSEFYHRWNEKKRNQLCGNWFWFDFGILSCWCWWLVWYCSGFTSKYFELGRKRE